MYTKPCTTSDKCSGTHCSSPSVPFKASLSPLLPRNSTVLNSKVISVTVKPLPRSLLTPLEIEFSHLYNVSLSWEPAPSHSCVCFCIAGMCWCKEGGAFAGFLSSLCQCRTLQSPLTQAVEALDCHPEIGLVLVSCCCSLPRMRSMGQPCKPYLLCAVAQALPMQEEDDSTACTGNTGILVPVHTISLWT